MKKIRVAIVGYGNIGRFALQAVDAAGDMECAGIVRRSGSAEGIRELAGRNVTADIKDLGPVDVAILCTPSRKVEESAKKYLAAGISTVDSFDIHKGIVDLRTALDPVSKENGAVSIISAGWDPGTDSIVRALLQAMAPKGETFTNFGPGRSMGHTVAAASVPGVRRALSMTIPEGHGIHSRQVYIELEEGYEYDEVAAAIKSDPYFASDETHVNLVEDVDALNTLMHGVDLEREGESGCTGGQSFDFKMRINNPALTGQVLVCAARAAARLKERGQAGCYTMIEVPVIDLLEGGREDLIAHLV